MLSPNSVLQANPALATTFSDTLYRSLDRLARCFPCFSESLCLSCGLPQLRLDDSLGLSLRARAGVLIRNDTRAVQHLHKATFLVILKLFDLSSVGGYLGVSFRSLKDQVIGQPLLSSARYRKSSTAFMGGAQSEGGNALLFELM